MNELLRAISAVCEDGLARNVAAAEGLNVVGQALEGLGEMHLVAPQRPGVVDAHLPDCDALARDPLARRLVRALGAAPEAVPWYPSKSYDGIPTMADFIPHYAVATIIGPERFGRPCPYFSDRALVGVTLQAPHIDYPAHAHEAVEIYYILAGHVDWRQGDGVWQPKRSGDFILHESHEPHAMRTGDEPLLAMFAWVSDLMASVYLVEED